MERVKERSAAAGVHSSTVHDPQKRRMACQTNVTGRFRGGDEVFCERVCDEVNWIPIVGYLIGMLVTCDWISGSPSPFVCLTARTEAKAPFGLRLLPNTFGLSQGLALDDPRTNDCIKTL